MLVSSIGLKSDNLMGLIGLIKNGLPVSTFNQLKEKLDVSEKTLMDTVTISKRTLTRRKHEGRLSVAESEKIVRIGRVFDKAVQVFGNDENIAARWFKKPARALGGKAPLELMDTEVGSQEVYALLVRIEHGVFPG